MTAHDLARDALGVALHNANIDCDYSRKFDRKSCEPGDGPHAIAADAILAALAESGWTLARDDLAVRLPEAIKMSVGAVIHRWYHLGLIRFNSHDDGSDDLLLRDEIVRNVRAAIEEATR